MSIRNLFCPKIAWMVFDYISMDTNHDIDALLMMNDKETINRLYRIHPHYFRSTEHDVLYRVFDFYHIFEFALINDQHDRDHHFYCTLIKIAIRVDYVKHIKLLFNFLAGKGKLYQVLKNHTSLIKDIMTSDIVLDRQCYDDIFMAHITTLYGIDGGNDFVILQNLLRIVDPTMSNNYALRKLSTKAIGSDYLTELLADGRVDPTVDNNMAIQLAANHRRYTNIMVLLEHSNNISKEIFDSLCELNHIPITEKLLEKEISSYTIPITKINNIYILKLLLSGRENDSEYRYIKISGKICKNTGPKINEMEAYAMKLYKIGWMKRDHDVVHLCMLAGRCERFDHLDELFWDDIDNIMRLWRILDKKNNTLVVLFILNRIIQMDRVLPADVIRDIEESFIRSDWGASRWDDNIKKIFDIIPTKNANNICFYVINGFDDERIGKLDDKQFNILTDHITHPNKKILYHLIVRGNHKHKVSLILGKLTPCLKGNDRFAEYGYHILCLLIKNDVRLVKLLIQNNYRYFKLTGHKYSDMISTAACYGRMEIIKMILKLDKRPVCVNYTHIIWASRDRKSSRRQFLECINLLISMKKIVASGVETIIMKALSKGEEYIPYELTVINNIIDKYVTWNGSYSEVIAKSCIAWGCKRDKSCVMSILSNIIKKIGAGVTDKSDMIYQYDKYFTEIASVTYYGYDYNL